MKLREFKGKVLQASASDGFVILSMIIKEWQSKAAKQQYSSKLFLLSIIDFIKIQAQKLKKGNPHPKKGVTSQDDLHKNDYNVSNKLDRQQILSLNFQQVSKKHAKNCLLYPPIQTPLQFVDNFIMEKDFECIKIKDGLYIGNKIVAMDLEFLLINKFAYVINCASETPNLFEAQGIKYLKFKLHHDKNQKIFDSQLKRLKKMKKIVEEAEENGMCCLIHCNNGYCRSLTILTAFLMDRFKWRLVKTADFLQSKGVSMMFTESNIQELKGLELMLSQEQKLSSVWGPPYVDQEEELITKTYINTSKKEPIKNMNKEKALKRDFFEEEVVVEKAAKRVQWLDRIEKEMKKEKQKLLAERTKQEKRENERSRGKIQEEMMKDSKAHNLIMPKDKSDLSKKMKKKIEPQLDPEIKKKIQEAEIMKLIKKSGKLKKELIAQDFDQPQQKLRGKEPSLQNLPTNKQQLHQNEGEEKKVYKLTINNYINPSINIIKPPLDKKKKPAKPTAKKQKDKFNRTYSQKETFKKPTFYDKQISKEKQGREKEKRNTGFTPVRSRKQRKSEKEKDLKV